MNSKKISVLSILASCFLLLSLSSYASWPANSSAAASELKQSPQDQQKLAQQKIIDLALPLLSYAQNNIGQNGRGGEVARAILIQYDNILPSYELGRFPWHMPEDKMEAKKQLSDLVQAALARIRSKGYEVNYPDQIKSVATPAVFDKKKMQEDVYNLVKPMLSYAQENITKDKSSAELHYAAQMIFSSGRILDAAKYPEGLTDLILKPYFSCYNGGLSCNDQGRKTAEEDLTRGIAALDNEYVKMRVAKK